MGKLEDFVQQNREGFDDKLPSDSLWQAISKELPEKKRKRRWWKPMLRVAAIALVFLSIGVAIGNYMGNTSSTASRTLSDISPEYAELEQFYTLKINQKIGQLDRFEQKEAVLEDLKELDQNFKELQQELGETRDEEQIIYLMIENYQTKISILERVLDRLGDEDIQNTNNHEETTL